MTRSFSRIFVEPGRGNARGYPEVLGIGATGWSFRSTIIDRPSIFGVAPLGKNTALPEKDTTTASRGCAVVGAFTSQTVTRSLSITGFSVGRGAAWKSIAL